MCGCESILVYTSTGTFWFHVTKSKQHGFVVRSIKMICFCLNKYFFLFRFAITREELEAGEEVATCPSCSLIVKVHYNKLSLLKKCKLKSYAVLRIHDILVRIRIRGSIPLTNGSYFRQWPSRRQQLLIFEGTFTSFFIDKKSQRSYKTFATFAWW